MARGGRLELQTAFARIVEVDYERAHVEPAQRGKTSPSPRSDGPASIPRSGAATACSTESAATPPTLVRTTTMRSRLGYHATIAEWPADGAVMSRVSLRKPRPQRDSVTVKHVSCRRAFAAAWHRCPRTAPSRSRAKQSPGTTAPGHARFRTPPIPPRGLASFRLAPQRLDRRAGYVPPSPRHAHGSDALNVMPIGVKNSAARYASYG